MSLAGRVALVTGAGRGIGKAIAQALAAKGAAVAVHYHASREGAEKLAEEIRARGGKALAIQADVSKRGDVERMAGQCAGALGPVDVLVNNARQLAKGKPFMDLDWSDYEIQIDVMLDDVQSDVVDLSGRVHVNGGQSRLALVIGGKRVSLGIFQIDGDTELEAQAGAEWLNEKLRSFPPPLDGMRAPKP